jgi:hypothetical protein
MLRETSGVQELSWYLKVWEILSWLAYLISTSGVCSGRNFEQLESLLTICRNFSKASKVIPHMRAKFK